MSQAQANLTFSITLLALGITTGFGGYFNSRFGPRTIAIVGGLLYGLGLLLADFSLTSIYLLYLTSGIIGGVGQGLGYPAFATNFFGPHNSGTIYGAMITTWNAGGIVDPLLIASIDYKITLFILFALILVSCALPLLAQMLTRQARVEPEATNYEEHYIGHSA